MDAQGLKARAGRRGVAQHGSESAVCPGPSFKCPAPSCKCHVPNVVQLLTGSGAAARSGGPGAQVALRDDGDEAGLLGDLDARTSTQHRLGSLSRRWVIRWARRAYKGHAGELVLPLHGHQVAVEVEEDRVARGAGRRRRHVHQELAARCPHAPVSGLKRRAGRGERSRAQRAHRSRPPKGMVNS